MVSKFYLPSAVKHDRQNKKVTKFKIKALNDNLMKWNKTKQAVYG